MAIVRDPIRMICQIIKPECLVLPCCTRTCQEILDIVTKNSPKEFESLMKHYNDLKKEDINGRR